MVRPVMRLRWFLAVAIAVALALCGGAASGSSSAQPPERGPGGDLLGPRMARAEIVVVRGGVVHDFRVDQGLLVVNRLSELVIRESDGTLQTVPVATAARVTLDAIPVAIARLRRGMRVVTLRDGDAPASVVRARGIFR